MSFMNPTPDSELDAENAARAAQRTREQTSNEQGPWWTPTVEVERLMTRAKATIPGSVVIEARILEGLCWDSLKWRKERAAISQVTPPSAPETGAPVIVAWAVGNVLEAPAIYNIHEFDRASDAARRWGKPITGLVQAPNTPTFAPRPSQVETSARPLTQQECRRAGLSENAAGTGPADTRAEARSSRREVTAQLGDPCPACASGRIGQSGIFLRCGNCGWMRDPTLHTKGE